MKIVARYYTMLHDTKLNADRGTMLHDPGTMQLAIRVQLRAIKCIYIVARCHTIVAQWLSGKTINRGSFCTFFIKKNSSHNNPPHLEALGEAQGKESLLSREGVATLKGRLRPTKGVPSIQRAVRAGSNVMYNLLNSFMLIITS